jgi:hypothetical protein
MGKKKNRSQTIPNGRTLQTRDEFFAGQDGYRKPGHGYNQSGYYRRVVVVDSNADNELAVVQLGSSGQPIPGYAHGKYKYRPFVKTKDNQGKPIKIGCKFKENAKGRDIPRKAVIVIKKDCFVNPKVSAENRRAVRRLKKRK